MIDRRAFLGVFAALPACKLMSVKVDTTPPERVSKPGRGPRDTDDASYDRWLDDHSKDAMHLDF